jgi:NAD-dependent SIR2 family protein deacetylase
VVPIAVASGADVAIVNGSPTAMDDLADVVVRGPISEILPALIADLSRLDRRGRRSSPQVEG